jgi:hypothetical protein
LRLSGIFSPAYTPTIRRRYGVLPVDSQGVDVGSSGKRLSLFSLPLFSIDYVQVGTKKFGILSRYISPRRRTFMPEFANKEPIVPAPGYIKAKFRP